MTRKPITLHFARKTRQAAFALMVSSSAFAISPDPTATQPPAVLTQATAVLPQIESAFSPEAGAERLVLKVIHSARQELRLAAYSFSSPAVTQALISAKQRGVDVQLVVDYKRNQGSSSIAALRLLAEAGIAVRTNTCYALHHDKYVIVDRQHVQNGSFNYTSGAAKHNSENVLVVWNDATLAAAYLQHWQSRWDQASILVPQH